MAFSLVALGVLLLLAWTLVRRRRAAVRASTCRQRFESVYSGLLPIPALTQDTRYGLPHFEVMFQDEAMLQAANVDGTNRRFLEAIDAACSDCGSRARPFDAKRAVFFTYPSHADELVRRHPEARNE